MNGSKTISVNFRVGHAACGVELDRESLARPGGHLYWNQMAQSVELTCDIEMGCAYTDGDGKSWRTNNAAGDIGKQLWESQRHLKGFYVDGGPCIGLAELTGYAIDHIDMADPVWE